MATRDEFSSCRQFMTHRCVTFSFRLALICNPPPLGYSLYTNQELFFLFHAKLTFTYCMHFCLSPEIVLVLHLDDLFVGIMDVCLVKPSWGNATRSYNLKMCRFSRKGIYLSCIIISINAVLWVSVKGKSFGWISVFLLKVFSFFWRKLSNAKKNILCTQGI